LCRCTGYRAIVSAVDDIAAQAEQGVDMSAKNHFPAELKAQEEGSLEIKGQETKWMAPTTLKQLLNIKSLYPTCKIVCGNTEVGIEQRFGKKYYPVLVSANHVKELSVLGFNDREMEIGSNVPLSEIQTTLKRWKKKLGAQGHRTEAIQAILDQLRWFSGPSIRNVASIGGNIVTASPISDLNPVFVALNARFKMMSSKGPREIPAREFFLGYRKTAAAPDEVLVSALISLDQPNQTIHAFKQCKRREDDIAIVNACMNIKISPEDKKIEDACLSFGGMAVTTITAPKTQAFLVGKQWNKQTVDEATKVLSEELKLPSNVPGGMSEYRTTLAVSFFYKFSLIVNQKQGGIADNLKSATGILEPTYPTGKQVYHNPSEGDKPVGEPIIHASSLRQVTGEAVYTDDLPKRPNELVAKLVVSSQPHAKILSIDSSLALSIPGVVGFFSSQDIPGSNMIGDIIQDEEVFASRVVTTVGQPIGVIVAEDAFAAQKAVSAIKIQYEPLPAILSLSTAIEKGSLYEKWNDTIERGDIAAGFEQSDHVLEGEVKIGGQEHFYFETNVTLAEPTDLEIKVYTSTQNLKITQISIASVLGIDCNKVHVSLKRIGGGFGGKETWNVPTSCIAAVAAQKTGRPVRLLLGRDEDMKWTGHRHPFYGKYKVGFNKAGIIQALDVQLINNGGNTYDLSGPVVNRAMFHSDNSYWIPNMRVRGRIAKTNTISNTAFRGFGGPQGMLIAETWIDHIASHLQLPPEKVRFSNLYKYGQTTHFKQPVVTRFPDMWNKCLQNIRYEEKIKERDEFNKNNRFKKMGVAIVPAKFGLAFTATFLNQGSALIHAYKDGSVLVTTGGVEMGQGLHTKCIQIASASLGIPVDKVYISETATDKIPNSSATAGSMGSDIYGMAVLKACEQLNERLQVYKHREPHAKFATWVKHAWHDRVNLSSQAFWKVPVTGYDFVKGEGQPFHYFTTGVAASQVIIDTLTGDHRLLTTDIVMDVGKSINPAIDVGQIEGAFVQGYGWLTMEELIWGDEDHTWLKPGHMLTAGPGNYKLPSVDDIPRDFNVTLMEASDNSPAVHSSRGVGEPPLLLSGSAVFALRDAIRAARADSGVYGHFPLNLPLTCERIRMACVDDLTKLTVGPNDSSYQTKGSW